MPKSSSFLRTQLLLRKERERRRLLAFDGEPTLASSPLDYYAHHRALERIGELESELDALRGSQTLDLFFSGIGVYDTSVTLSRLKELVDPLGRAMRWTAHDQALMDGDEMAPGTTIAELREPVLTGTVRGSFGLRVARAPVAEQGSLIKPTLFERTASRFVEVFRTARDSREPSEVVGVLSGFGPRAVHGFQDLAVAFVASAQTTRIRWQDDDFVAVTPSVAAQVVSALSKVRIYEENEPITGILTGGDMADSRFHLIASDEQGRTRHYRGDVEPDALTALRAIPLESRVAARVTTVRAESDLFGRARPPRYILVEVRPLSTTDER